jgi:F-type H+-transporting ATPase subunit c
MIKKITTVFMTIFAFLLSSQLVFAAKEATEAAASGGESYVKALFVIGAMIGAGIAMGVGAVGAGLGIGTATNGACQAVGRNPGVQGKIMMTMLIGMAMAESIAIYALVISLVLLFANPFAKFFLG